MFNNFLNLEFFNFVFLGNTLLNYIIFLLIIFGSVIVAKIVSYIFKNYFIKLAKKTKTKVDNILAESLEKPVHYGVFFFGLYWAMQYIVLSARIETFFNSIFLIIFSMIATTGVVKVAKGIVENYWFLASKKKQSEHDKTMIPFIKTVLSIVIWSVAFVFVLNNLGVQVTSLIAGLGIGGVAIAFALQNILSDLFSSVSIYFDKPFEIGDFIVIGDDSGTVKHIGLKSTRITTLQGEELIISNKDLTNTRVKNYKKMRTRRIVFYFGVEYGTPSSKLKKIPEIVKKIIDKTKDVDFSRCHFSDFGDFSLNYEIVMIIKNRDYTLYRDVQEKVNLGIVDAFNKEKISMAFPTQTIFVKK